MARDDKKFWYLLMKFFIKSFGCQYNEWDAARLSFVLKNIGLIEAEKEEADIVFLLNCSVRKTGVDRAMGFTKNFIKEGKKVFISGCVLEGDKKIFREKGAEVWDNENIAELKKCLNLDNNAVLRLAELFTEGEKVSNYIPIIKGCDNFCSYCAVPYTRGREVSRPVGEIIESVKKVVAFGHKEVWLLGQNVNSYKGSRGGEEGREEDKQGKDVISTSRGIRDEKSHELQEVSHFVRNDKMENVQNGDEIRDDKMIIGFAELLKLINDIPGDFTIYFTSNHPKDMGDEIIDAIARSPKVAKSIHLPLQSGSNRILKLMNRPYTKEQYLELIKKIRSIIPEAKITTDTIVGFPGETLDDFQETVEVLQKVGFYQAYNNKYSPRIGTRAFQLGDPISWPEKQRRWKILNEITYKK
jgi:tRNA-2-methylthio-N6-dimethylallyladenosine synthase